MTTKRKTKARAKKPARKTQARKAAAKKRATKATKPRDPKAPAVGTVLTRVFKRKSYEVKVTAEGYVLGDVTFRTLTGAAKAISGYASVSGPRFFGTDAASKAKGGA